MATRREQLEALIEALRPVVLASHSEPGLQGLSGLVGQYRAALAEVEELRKLTEIPEGTALDEFTRRRAERQASHPSGSAKRQQRGR